MYETVLVPTDGSAVAERAFAEAFELAGATVHALCVVDIVTVVEDGIPYRRILAPRSRESTSS